MLINSTGFESSSIASLLGQKAAGHWIKRDTTAMSSTNARPQSRGYSTATGVVEVDELG